MSTFNVRMKALADMIRSKTGKTDSLSIDKMTTDVGSLANVTAVSAEDSDVRSGVSYVDSNGVLVPGTMPDNGELSEVINAKDQLVQIAEGYYSGGSIKISTDEQAKIIPENIKSGVSVLGVTGDYVGGAKIVTGLSTDDRLVVTNETNNIIRITLNNLGFNVKYVLLSISLVASNLEFFGETYHGFGDDDKPEYVILESAGDGKLAMTGVGINPSAQTNTEDSVSFLALTVNPLIITSCTISQWIAIG